MKTKIIPRVIIAISLFSVFLFSSTAQLYALELGKPLAGDKRCGNPNPCPIKDIFSELKDVFIVAVIVVGLLAILAFVILGFKGLSASDQPAVLAEAKKQGGRALVVLIVLVFFGSLVTVFLDALVKPEYTDFLKQLFSSFNDSIFSIQSAYAQTQPKSLPNALVVDSVYDVGIIIYQLVMRWILIPVLIASWVWAGLLFVTAIGNPKKLEYAKSRLYYSVIWTVILMLVLGLAFAFRDTFNQIIS